MKKPLIWLVAAVLTLTLASANAESGKERTGKVVRIKGDARYSTGNKIWQPLKVGAIIKSGNVVQTAPNSFVDIVLNQEDSATAVAIQPISTSPSAASASSGGGGAGVLPSPDQDVVRVLDDTYLVFDSLNATPTGDDTTTETLLDLKKGSIFASVKKQAAASRFEVKIPNGVAGIRGSWVLFSASGKISCLAGSAVAAYSTSSSPDVNTQVIGAGQEFDCATGQGSALSSALRGFMSMMAKDCNYPSGDQGGRGRGRGHGHGPGDHGSDHVSNHKP